MKVFYSDIQTKHDPQMFLVSGAPQPSPEQPERATRLLASAKAAGLTEEAPKDFGVGPIARVHTPEYIAFLSGIYERWQRIEGASPEVIPNIHPDRRDGAYPASAVGQAGYHQTDTACPIGPHSWESIRWSANSAVAAAQAVAAGDRGVGDRGAYALCRPPGHHAFKDLAGGFCFVNNSGVAAAELRRTHERVAILDVDLHHGNGTQGMFYDRNDVLTVSIHADPVRFYPFFWGHADERGEGAGLGYNLNLPIPRGTEDANYMPVLEQAIQRIDAFAPDALVIALGLDGFEGDPFGGLRISTEGFAKIGQRIGQMNLPTVLVQEGGYLCDDLGTNLERFLDGFANG
ncbi:histone deacetylase family protein [Rhodospirillaceae bacterium KN72]|uniref:Histone deacetylase family protein n=1 Tax=Pacificispira spongiicola TaxID=2729598 RepID=A0A7Y0DXB3_9PROT|nr:histone deacetylase family protein [Pacificispira spongiicola]NMM43301.1 histone deacetylase family protein [Pacificispira spongiicola]